MRRSGIQFRFFVALIIVAVIPLILFGMYGYRSSSELVERVEVEKIGSYHASIENDIESFFTTSGLDVQFLKELLALDWDTHGSIEMDEFVEHSTTSFVSFLSSHTHYDHIRLLDNSGMEVVRVNNKGGNQIVIPKERLQDKSDRYYFMESESLVDGEVFISPIDLNVENNILEKPYKAVIRYVAPMDLPSELGNERFYLVMNLNVSHLLADIRDRIEESPYRDTYIADEAGYYMLHSLRQKEWGSLNNIDTGESFKKDVSKMPSWNEADLYNKVIIEVHKGLERADDDFIYWTPLYIEPVAGLRLNLITVEPREHFMAPVYAYLQSYTGLIISTFAILFFISTAIARTLSHPIKRIAEAVSEIGKGKFDAPLEVNGGVEVEILAYEIKKMAFELESSYRDMELRVTERTIELQNAHDKLQQMANTDPLTGIFNRHFFNNYIENLKRDKRITDLALIMLDVDRFKYINDHYGHNVGDVVLVEVAELLSSETRGSDFVVRYGGDEFLIVLLDSHEDAIQAYVARIKSALEKWNKNTDILEHDMEFSIGCDVYEEGKHIMDVIKAADERMYANKMARRKARGQTGRV